MAGRRQKKSGGRSYAWRYRGRIVACVFVEVIIICALVIMIGWNKGVKEWFEQFEQPVLKEVDISGINSPNAILMQPGEVRFWVRLTGRLRFIRLL